MADNHIGFTILIVCQLNVLIAVFFIGVTLNFDDGKPTIDEDKKKLAEIWNSVDRTKTPKKEEKEDDDDDDYI